MASPVAVLAQKADPAAPASRAAPPPPSTSAASFAAADAHADAAPASAERSVTALAAYLAGAGDELARARALYRWVATHVDYDVSGFSSGSYGDLSPEGVLQRRTAVCEGYARLTEALGAAMGLRVAVVSGWSKGYGYRLGQTFEGQPNHAWNAVQVAGAWRLMDPTWGAGYLDERMQFVRRFQEHYFLTAPEAFIYDHLPTDEQWQLLARPLSAAQYGELAYLRPAFFSSGLRIGSHGAARIGAGARARVTVGVTQPVDILAQLVDGASGQRVEGTWTLVQPGETETEISAAFPRAGGYVLRLFARPRGSAAPAQWALDYNVDASAGAPDGGFPMAYGSFGRAGVRLFEPLSGTLAAGRGYRFRLRVPGAIEVAIVASGRWTHLARSGEEFTTEFTAVPGEVTVFARFTAGEDFTGLLRYTSR